jgi:hypothetical protein
VHLDLRAQPQRDARRDDLLTDNSNQALPDVASALGATVSARSEGLRHGEGPPPDTEGYGVVQSLVWELRRLRTRHGVTLRGALPR